VKASTYAAALLLATCGVGVARLQPRLAGTVHAVKEGDEMYTLPPPAELHASTLGWDAAAVDLLWATLLVEYGIHWSERREFLNIPKYVDAILEIEPTFAPMYKYVDTMLAYRPLRGTEQDVRMARRYLERGTRERSQDPRVWMQYGQFLAFIAPSFLSDDAERDAFRKAGATAIGHAVELGGDAERAIAAASILTRAGATEAAIRYLERAYAITPALSEEHEAISRKLASLEARAFSEAADAAARTIDARWKDELPFVTRDAYLLLGPKADVSRCSGHQAAADAACARDWRSVISPSESPADSP
jgi:tetratricopeptide (TPR) repeat protein